MLTYGVLHHVPDRAALCREIGRLLKPQGTFFASKNNRSVLRAGFEVLQRLRPLWHEEAGEFAQISRHQLARWLEAPAPREPLASRSRGSVNTLSTALVSTAVDQYWTQHTVRAERFRSRRASKRNLEWRFSEYPLFRELSGLWGDHNGEVILDYGCGPGNDLTGFAINTSARRIIGLDVSKTALDVAARRLELHGIDEGRVELMPGADGDPSIPLEDASVDHVNCQGVLHHTTDPDAIVAELARVVRSGGSGTVMVYNRDSIWFHLYTAYERMIVEDVVPGADVHEAFRRNTDGPECPISRSYPPEEFAGLCRGAGFEVEYVGGYLSKHELNVLDRSWARAIADVRLAAEHRGFLRALTYDFAGRPMHEGLHAGIGGTYRLRKP